MWRTWTAVATTSATRRGVRPTARTPGWARPTTPTASARNDGPNARAVSNRIINDANQNVFSERRVTQWGWTWGQFLDHTFGLRADDRADGDRGEHPVQAPPIRWRSSPTTSA